MLSAGYPWTRYVGASYEIATDSIEKPWMGAGPLKIWKCRWLTVAAADQELKKARQEWLMADG